MGTASIIIGVIVFVTALFPYLGYMIIIPAVVGLIIGIAALQRRSECIMALSGVVLNGFSLVLALFWTGILSFVSVNVLDDVIMQEQPREHIQIIYPMRNAEDTTALPDANSQKVAPKNNQTK